MDKRSAALQDANLRICSVFKQYPEDLAKNETMAATAITFESQVDGISKLSVKIGAIPAVNATSKGEARTRLMEICLKVGALMHVLAGGVNDMTLQNFIILTGSSLRRLRSADMDIYAQALVQYVNQYTDKISSVGITETQVTILTNTSSEYNTLLEMPKEMVNKRKDLLGVMKKELGETTDIIETKFDLLIKGYDSNDPFAIAYKSARIVVDPITIHRKSEDDTTE